MYQLLNTEHTICYDVDDTLLMWDVENYIDKDIVTIVDPYTKVLRAFGIHRPHVLLMKQYKERGYKIVVWSKGGELHAESAVKALGLENVVDYVMTKPEKVVDDKSEVLSIVGPVLFLKPQDPPARYTIGNSHGS